MPCRPSRLRLGLRRPLTVRSGRAQRRRSERLTGGLNGLSSRHNQSRDGAALPGSRTMARLGSRLALGVACAALAATSIAMGTADAVRGATDWPSTNYDQSANRYSPLTQITARNVATLQQV